MTEARRGEIHERSQSRSVPRKGGVVFDPGDNELNSSIHVMRTLKRRLKIVSITNDEADYSQNLSLSTGNYNFVVCSVSMRTHFYPVSKYRSNEIHAV